MGELDHAVVSSHSNVPVISRCLSLPLNAPYHIVGLVVSLLAELHLSTLDSRSSTPLLSYISKPASSRVSLRSLGDATGVYVQSLGILRKTEVTLTPVIEFCYLNGKHLVSCCYLKPHTVYVYSVTKDVLEKIGY